MKIKLPRMKYFIILKRKKINPRVVKTASPTRRSSMQEKNAICGLAKIFTVLLVAGYFPVSWRSVRISMIPKSGKNLRHSKNWRPISLSSCISKIFESCIKERFEKEKEKRQIKESIFQSAYKKNRGCQEQIVRLSDNVTQGFARQEST